MGDALFTDPNCTGSARWSAWRESMGRGVVFAPEASEQAGPAAEAAGRAEAEATRLGLNAGEADACFLGAAALLLMQVAGAWRRGRFFLALQTFAALHDEFLTNMHPYFYEQSAWPLHDAGMQDWKSRFLAQVRRFRELVGRRVDGGSEDFSAAAFPDDVERENLGSLASHALAQRERQSRRAALAGASWSGLTSSWSSAGRSQELVPCWEVPAMAAVVPSAASVRPALRIYVYEAWEVPRLAALTRAPAFCHYRQWGMDVSLHDFFRASPLRTLDPREADYFFVPSYACCHQVAGLHEFRELDTLHLQVVRSLPYFARRGGEDHIFSFHYVDLFPSWRQHIARSVFLTPETEVGFERSREEFSLDPGSFPPFDPAKDLSIPPFINPSDVLGFHRHARPVSSRQHLAMFAGKLWYDVAEAADVRGRVAALAGQPGVVIHAYESISTRLGPDAMQSLMGDARFCLVPRGRAAWSVRFFEALWAGCVPVLLSDYYRPPFDELFNISEFVVRWPMARIDSSLVDFLAHMPVREVERYVTNARRVRCWYLFPPPEVSWLGSWQARQELEELEDKVCPGLSSSRNAFQSVAELLARRARRGREAHCIDGGAPGAADP